MTPFLLNCRGQRGQYISCLGFTGPPPLANLGFLLWLYFSDLCCAFVRLASWRGAIDSEELAQGGGELVTTAIGTSSASIPAIKKSSAASSVVGRVHNCCERHM